MHTGQGIHLTHASEREKKEREREREGGGGDIIPKH
jgi:hypothetical protein